MVIMVIVMVIIMVMRIIAMVSIMVLIIMIIIVIIVVIIMLNNLCFHVNAQNCQVVGLSSCQVQSDPTDRVRKSLFELHRHTYDCTTRVRQAYVCLCDSG